MSHCGRLISLELIDKKEMFPAPLKSLVLPLAPKLKQQGCCEELWTKTKLLASEVGFSRVRTMPQARNPEESVKAKAPTRTTWAEIACCCPELARARRVHVLPGNPLVPLKHLSLPRTQ